MDGVTVSAAASSVMLKSEAQWTRWISSIENIATTYHVWHVCDPNLTRDEVQLNVIPKPDRPKAPIHPSKVPGASPDEDDDTEDVKKSRKIAKAAWKAYQEEMDEYDRDYKAWSQEDSSLIIVNNQIIARLDISHHTLINGAGFSTPYDKLVKLREVFGRISARPYKS
ncbi:hypothetical protein N7540_011554 [Penicillium herquei]|nr:hypothetical protein N7540_011554 [Penicillium herquei]